MPGYHIAIARAYRNLGDGPNALDHAQTALSLDPEYVRFAPFDNINGPGNEVQDAIFTRGTFDDLQPLVRLDFLDPKYFIGANPSPNDDEEADIAYIKAEEAYLIEAEVQLANGKSRRRRALFFGIRPGVWAAFLGPGTECERGRCAGLYCRIRPITQARKPATMAASQQRPVRIAMWSGPRNISTALMRSWEARGDTYVSDEPLYAHYLDQTGTAHPGREEIIATYETCWREVVRALTGPVPDGKTIYYQKHMAHHLLPGMDGTWLSQLRHGFLIRDPKEMLISLTRVMDEPAIEDTGLPQQNDLLDHLGDERGSIPPIIDARDVLEHPEPMLRKLCYAFDVAFSPEMLSWRRGTRPTDGIWSRYWYASVCESTGFRAYLPPERPLPERLHALYGECLPYYERLYHLRLTP